MRLSASSLTHVPGTELVWANGRWCLSANMPHMSVTKPVKSGINATTGAATTQFRSDERNQLDLRCARSCIRNFGNGYNDIQPSTSVYHFNAKLKKLHICQHTKWSVSCIRITNRQRLLTFYFNPSARLDNVKNL